MGLCLAYAAVAAKISWSEAVVSRLIDIEKRPVRAAIIPSRVTIFSTLYNITMAAIGNEQEINTVKALVNRAIDLCVYVTARRLSG